MQDKEFDNMDELIREASGSYHPVYDDKAWQQMEVLLDKHLPQNKDRRKPVGLFLLLLLIGGMATFGILFTWDRKENRAVEKREHKLAATQLYGKPENIQRGGATVITKGPKNIQLKPTVTLVDKFEGNKTRNLKNLSSGKRLVLKPFIIKISGADAVDGIAADGESVKNDAGVLRELDEVFVNNDITLLPKLMEINLQDKTANSFIPAVINDSALFKAATVAINKLPAEAASGPVLKKPINQKNKKGFANKFAIIISAGPERSFIGLSNPGKTRLIYGGGVSYPVAKKITMRSGFYVTRKIYSAKPGDYHPPASYWTNNANVQRIDADCKVYEIPLTVSYNFKQVKKHNWFAGIGLSTFIMKKETYHYLFKNVQGQTMYRGWTAPIRNVHYFSVLTISGGYQYHINKHFSIITEPYFKLPLQGIGFGKIKLNSGGLLMSASIKPFAKRK